MFSALLFCSEFPRKFHVIIMPSVWFGLVKFDSLGRGGGRGVGGSSTCQRAKETCLEHNFIIILMTPAKRLATLAPCTARRRRSVHAFAYFVCRWTLTDSARDATYSTRYWVLGTTLSREQPRCASRDTLSALPFSYVRDSLQVLCCVISISLVDIIFLWLRRTPKKHFINAHKFVRNYNKNP